MKKVILPRSIYDIIVKTVCINNSETNMFISGHMVLKKDDIEFHFMNDETYYAIVNSSEWKDKAYFFSCKHNLARAEQKKRDLLVELNIIEKDIEIINENIGNIPCR